MWITLKKVDWWNTLQPLGWSWNLSCCRLFASSWCLWRPRWWKNAASLLWSGYHAAKYESFLLTTAEEAGIRLYYSRQRWYGGVSALKNGGVPSATIGVCARYITPHQTTHGWSCKRKPSAASIGEGGSLYSWFDQTLLNNIDLKAP